MVIMLKENDYLIMQQNMLIEEKGLSVFLHLLLYLSIL